MVTELTSYNGTRVAQDVKDKFGDSGGVQITDTMITRWLNDGIRHIAETSQFLKLIANVDLVLGQSTYSLAAAAPRLQAVESMVANGTPVKMVTFAQYQLAVVGMLDSDDDNGPSTYGTFFGGTLTLWPTPEANVTGGLIVYYSGYPAEVTDLTALLPVPDRFQNVLRDYVFAQALELDENWQASQIKLTHVQQDLAAQYDRETRSPTDFYPTLVNTEDDDYLGVNGDGRY